MREARREGDGEEAALQDLIEAVQRVHPEQSQVSVTIVRERRALESWRRGTPTPRPAAVPPKKKRLGRYVLDSMREFAMIITVLLVADWMIWIVGKLAGFW